MRIGFLCAPASYETKRSTTLGSVRRRAPALSFDSKMFRPSIVKSLALIRNQYETFRFVDNGKTYSFTRVSIQLPGYFNRFEFCK